MKQGEREAAYLLSLEPKFNKGLIVSYLVVWRYVPVLNTNFGVLTPPDLLETGQVNSCRNKAAEPPPHSARDGYSCTPRASVVRLCRPNFLLIFFLFQPDNKNCQKTVAAGCQL